MVTLKEITEDNFDECIKLDVSPDQQDFVSNNAYSLAQAWLYPNNARPFAIYDGDTMVGFLMLNIDLQSDGSNKVCELWRLMIDKRYQGKGFGRAATNIVLERVKENPKHEIFRTSFVPGNAAAEKLYKSLGLVENGELDGEEIVLALDLRG